MIEKQMSNVKNKPKWAVYFDGDFWTHTGRKQAGKELKINKHFTWDNQAWYIPSVYMCSQGLVVDFCVKIPFESIRIFIEKWKLSTDTNLSDFTNEQQMQMEAENPLIVHCSPEVFVNSKSLPFSHSSCLSWNPCFEKYNDSETKKVLKHYKLALDCGWIIWRVAFPWVTVRKPKIAKLNITLKHDDIPVPSFHFFVSSDEGRSIKFAHPVTSNTHILTVQEYKQQEVPENGFGDASFEYPTHYIIMSYTISPDLPDCEFQMIDCDNGDRPRKKQTSCYESQSTAECAVIGVIGGDTVVNDSGECLPLRAVCSALHFKPVNCVEWRTVFYKKRCDDITLKLI